MEGTMGRLLELKHTLVEIESNHYTLLDDILADVKLTPEDVEIPTPAFFRRENLKQLKERERVLDDYDAETLDPRLKPPEAEPEKMTVEQAIRIVQIHERARQGRLRAKFMQDIRAQEERERRARENPNHVKLKPEQAALILQKYIRGWAVRYGTARMPPCSSNIGLRSAHMWRGLPPCPNRKNGARSLSKYGHTCGVLSE